MQREKDRAELLKTRSGKREPNVAAGEILTIA